LVHFDLGFADFFVRSILDAAAESELKLRPYLLRAARHGLGTLVVSDRTERWDPKAVPKILARRDAGSKVFETN
jgi:hypothetical protein